MSSDDFDKAISEIDSKVEQIKHKKELEAKRLKLIADAEKIKKEKEQKELEQATTGAISFKWTYLFFGLLLSAGTYIYFSGLSGADRAEFILYLFLIGGITTIVTGKRR
jgi:hypothetical protein